jgi:Golgi phosphoprotein 3 (GPP34)
MDELGEDLLLIAVNSDRTLVLPVKLRFGLAGSELVRLAAARRVDIVRGRIVIRNSGPTGDPLLDDALASMSGGWHEPTAKAWVKRMRPGLVERYLARAESAGTIQAHRRKALGFIPVTRWVVIDTARAEQACARLEAAASDGILGPEQAALAGLASAIDVTHFVFPGRAGAKARKRLREAAGRVPAAAEATAAVADAAAAAAQHAAVDAATRAATDAAVRAATDAAVSAAIDAATHAAVSAAAEPPHSAGGHPH